MSNKKVIANDIFFASVEELVAEGQSVEMTVKGFSMRPFLRNERDVVVLSPTSAERLRCGMVVLFRHRGSHVLHRLVKIEGPRLTMEGDGNYRQVEVASTADVVAYVSQVKVHKGPTIRYNSVGWRRRTALSICRKRLRTLAIDIKRKLFK